MSRKYDLAPLAAVAGVPFTALGRVLGLSGSTWKQAREQGVGEKAADRYAVRLGFHPFMVWPEMAEHAAEDAAAAEEARRERQRAADRRYKAKRRKDPAVRAKQARYLRDYRSSERAKEAARQQRRAYYRANRERELERQRQYDRTVRAERRRQAAA